MLHACHIQKGATATAVQHTFEGSEVPMRDQEKQGGKCCGGCCDYRRAVIILCIISLCFTALGFVNNASTSIDDDEYPKLTQIYNDHATGILIVGIVGIVLTVLELVGAIIFNFYMVALYVVWSILELILSIVLTKSLVDEVVECLGDTTCLLEGASDTTVDVSDEDIKNVEDAMNIYLTGVFVSSAIFTFLWVYPSVMLAVEIKKGIMTRETYPREEMSCCCVQK